MKKIYSLALCAAVAMSASAAGLTPLTGKTAKEIKKAAIISEKVGDSKIQLDRAKPAKAPAKISSNEMAGDYTFTLGDYYFTNSEGQIEAEGTIELSGLSASVDCDEFPLAITATTNISQSVLKFKAQEYGALTTTSGSVVYVKAYPYVFDYDAEDIVAEEFSATFDGTEFTIPADHGIAWEGFSDENYTEHVTWFGIYDLEGMVKGSFWEDYGTITFVDGILTPTFGVTITEPSTCELYKSTKYEEYYRIDHPWEAMYNLQGWESTSPSIFLDASDASNVIMEMVSTGISGGTTIGTYYIMSQSYYDSLSDDTTPDESKITLTKADGVGTFDFPQNSCYMYAPTASKLYYAAKTPTQMTFSIPDNSSVDAIGIDAANDGEVKYYNLQGVQVAAPAAGQLVIRVQGNKATKTIIR